MGGKEMFLFVMQQCYRFMMHPFIIYGFHFSLFNVTLLAMSFEMIMNMCARILGKMEVETDDE